MTIFSQIKKSLRPKSSKGRNDTFFYTTPNKGQFPVNRVFLN